MLNEPFQQVIVVGKADFSKFRVCQVLLSVSFVKDGEKSAAIHNSLVDLVRYVSELCTFIYRIECLICGARQRGMFARSNRRPSD